MEARFPSEEKATAYPCSGERRALLFYFAGGQFLPLHMPACLEAAVGALVPAEVGEVQGRIECHGPSEILLVTSRAERASVSEQPLFFRTEDVAHLIEGDPCVSSICAGHLSPHHGENPSTATRRSPTSAHLRRQRDKPVVPPQHPSQRQRPSAPGQPLRQRPY